MIVLYLKDVDIDTLPPTVEMFYRITAFKNSIDGVNMRRLLFDHEPRIEYFKAVFPEIVPYLTREAE